MLHALCWITCQIQSRFSIATTSQHSQTRTDLFQTGTLVVGCSQCNAHQATRWTPLSRLPRRSMRLNRARTARRVPRPLGFPSQDSSQPIEQSGKARPSGAVVIAETANTRLAIIQLRESFQPPRRLLPPQPLRFQHHVPIIASIMPRVNATRCCGLMLLPCFSPTPRSQLNSSKP